MKPIAYQVPTIIDGKLVCPCDGHSDYMALTCVEQWVYQGGVVRHMYAGGEVEKFEMLKEKPANLKGDTCLRFSCESCGGEHSLWIGFHKGNTLIQWE